MTYSFYGAKVIDFNLQGSFGGDIALDINLTECEFTNPAFSPPIIGSPVKFQTDTFSFYGILDTTKSDNNYMYSAQINNGLHIIGGVELILNDYFGSVNSVPNLINIFGYKENTLGFGGSEVNNAGISWSIIANAVTNLVNNISGNSYGGPITYKGFKYKIDLTELPNIPDYYRINNDNINLVDFIGEVCSAGGHDFFIILIEPTPLESAAGWSGTFKVKTISRINEPVPGKVQEFIESAICVTSKNYGLEVRKDVHSKFVVGANLERIYFNYPQNGGDNSFDGGFIDKDEYVNDTILPFFGVDKNNNVIVGFTPSGEPDEYYFNIDVSDIKGLEGSGDYLTCLSELKAARKGRNSWENFLCTRDANEYVIDPSGSFGSKYRFKVKLFDNKNLEPFMVDGEYHSIPKYGYVFLRQIGETGLINQFYPFTGISAAYSGNRILRYPSKGAPNYYFQRATKLKISSGRRIAYARMFESDLYLKSLDNEKLALAYEKFKSEGAILSVESNQLQSYNTYMSSRFKDLEESFNDNITDQVYRKIKGYADTYYNKKFMVSIPFTLGAIEPESTTIRMSQEPINEGYLDESVWPTAYNSGLIPDISGINTLVTPDNKFYPFVKYENCVVIDNTGVIRGNPGDIYKSLYDFSEISASDKIFSTPRQYTEPSGIENNGLGITPSSGFTVFDCWVKCSVDEKIYFHDSQTLFGPRAVIEIPGSVKKNIGPDAATYAGALIRMFNISKANGGAFADDPNVSGDYFRKQFDKIGSDDSFNHDGEPIQYANLYAIPLRSKLLSYGPWYAIGADGKVSYERNTDLNPWNYGGFSAMNTAGLARVQDGVTNQTFSEVGSVTVQGMPTLNFGDPLIAEGPYINSISCSFGQQGKTTTYNFQAWSSHRSLSKLNGYAIERNKNLNRTMMEIKSNFREGIKNGRFKNVGDFYNKVSNRFIDLNDYTRRDRPSTSSKVISAEMNGPSATVVIQPNYNAAAQAYSDYENKAFVSLDGLFRPYSTIEKSGWPSFVMPESSGSGEINVLTLNPIQSGVDFDVVSRGTGYQDGGLLPEDTLELDSVSGVIPARSIGIRMPMIGVGWGFDIDGNPVPSGNGPNGFSDDYLYNSSKWQAGPIDIRWDPVRKVWAAGGGQTKIYLSKVTNTYNPSNVSYEVERSNSRSQFTRNAPASLMPFNPSGAIHDPEYVAYTGNPDNTGTYELLNYTNIDYPYYEAFIIRQTTDDTGNEYYNIWSEDCNDCGHVSNPCGSGYGHGYSSVGKKILIENPLKQSLDVGDLAFTINTGKKKKVNTGSFIGGSGVGASGYILTNPSGVASFVVAASGSGYSNGGFGIINSSNVCCSVNLNFIDGKLTSGTVTPASGFSRNQTYNVNIYPLNSVAETESLPIHWILQAEFKTQQLVSHVECENGIMQTCSVKIQTQGWKSCEWCGTSDALLGSF